MGLGDTFGALGTAIGGAGGKSRCGLGPAAAHGSSVTANGGTSVVGGTAVGVSVNPSFNGSSAIELVATGSTLAVAEAVEIAIGVLIMAPTLSGFGPTFTNQVSVTEIGPSGGVSHGERPDVVVPITVLLPQPGSPLSDASAEAVALLVSESTALASAQSVEEDLEVEAFSTGPVQGAYFSATDKAPPVGEFKYMSQGVATLGELAITFTALSHADPDGARDSMLAIVESLRIAEGGPSSHSSR